LKSEQALGNRIFSAYGTSLLGVFSGLITNFWLLRKITQEIPASTFGIYALVLQVTAYLAILQLGLDFAAARKIAECVGRQDGEGANYSHWEVARFNRYAGLGGMLIVLIIAAGLWRGIGLSAISTGHVAAIIALFTGAVQILNFFSRRYAAALIGSQFQHVVNLSTVAKTIGTSLLAYGLLRAGLGINCIPVASFVFGLLTLAYLHRETTRRCFWLRSRPAEKNSAILKDLMGFGGLTSLGGVAWTIEATSDVFILGAYQGASVVGVYVLWWRFPNMIFDFCTRLATSAFPGFAERHGQSFEDARRLLNKIGQLTVGLATLALVGISLWLPTFIRAWIGKGYALPNGAAIAFGMALLVALRICGNLFGMFWLASGSAKVPTALGIAQATVKILLGLALVRSEGMLGMIIASCAASALQVAVMGLLLHRQRFVAHELSRNTALLSSMALVIGVIACRMDFSGSVTLLVIGVLATLLLWGAFWLLLAWPTELQTNLGRLLRPLAERL
jgi:O-antigen/teichoic acid export membrane protein